MYSSRVLLLLIGFFFINALCGLSFITISKCQKTHIRAGALYFTKNEVNSENGIIGSVWNSLRRFLPSTSRSRLVETYKTPQSDPGNRYHVRIVDVVPSQKRHVITRLRRYIPDLSWETAEAMVDTAIDKGASLVRVLSSKTEAAYLVDMLRKADPPVHVQVYDARKDDIVHL